MRREKIIFTSTLYIEGIIAKAGLQDGKISRIPMDVGYINLERKNCNLLDNNIKYREIIGCLLFLCVHTRPDISAVVSILSQRVSNPAEKD